MTLRRKLLRFFIAGAALLLALLAGVILYLYAHPAHMKPLLEKAISSATNTQVVITGLSYSLSPMSIRATGITVKSVAEGVAFQAEIPLLKTEMALEGSFGGRTLVIESLTVVDASATLSKHVRPPQAPIQRESPPLLDRAAKRLREVLLFRDIQFRSLEVKGCHVNARLPQQEVEVGELRATLTEGRGLEVLFGARLSWPAQETCIRAPKVMIAVDRVPSLAEPQIRSAITVTDASFESPELTAASIDLAGEFTYDHNRRELGVEGVELTARGRTPKQRVDGKPLSINLRLSASGRYPLDEAFVEVPRFHLAVDDLADVRGAAHAQFATETKVALRVEEGRLFPSTLLGFLGQDKGRQHPPFNLSGPVEFRGELSGQREESRWSWMCDIYGRLRRNQFLFRRPELRLESLLSADLHAWGVVPFPEISLSVQADGTSVSGRGFELKPFSSQLLLSGRYPAFALETLTANLPAAAVTVGNRQIPIADIRVRARGGRLHVEAGSLSLPEIRLDSSLLRNLVISAEIDRGRLELALDGREVNLAGSVRALGLVPAGWQLTGRDSIQVAASVAGDERLSFRAVVAGKEIAFQSEDGGSVGEMVSMGAEIRGRGRLRESELAATGSLRIDGGEILHDRFYLDLSRNGLFCSGRAQYDAAKKRLDFSDVRVGLKNLLSFTSRGTMVHGPGVPKAQLSVELSETPVEPIFRQFVAEPFRNSSPFLAGSTLSGTISTRLDINGGGNGLEIKGRVGWHGGGLSSTEESLSLGGVDLELPIWYRSEEDGTIGEPLKGTFSVQAMSAPPLPEQPLLLPLSAAPNRLSVDRPTSLALPAGEVGLGPVSGRNIFDDSAIVETSLAVERLPIGPLVKPIWPQAPEGDMSGRLDRIVIRGERLSSSGELVIKALGGKITLADVGVSGITGPAPLIGLNVEVDHLDLAGLTAGTGFGKIEGVLRGHVRNLEIAAGQPQRFDLLLETAEERAGSQKISVRAVENIAQIGGAQSPFLGMAKVLASVFNDFPYSKIGVRATLENDIFRVNGTIKQGGREYLVRRGALWGVDVINQSPDNRISFKDMIKRLRRITESRGGPVVR
jgi:hypothetical protein